MAIAPLGRDCGDVIPYHVTTDFMASYQSVEDDLAPVLDDGLEKLLSGLRATAAGRHRVKGEEGGAYVFEIATAALIWHVYWDYAVPDRSAIALIGLVLIQD